MVAPPIRLAAIAPELALVITAFLMLLVDGMVKGQRDRWFLPVMSTVGLGVSMYFAIDAWGTSQLQLARMVAVDGFGTFVKVTLGAFGVFTVWLSSDYLKSREIEESEFYALVLFAVAGMMLMAVAADLILMFIALETFSIALYVLVGFRRTDLFSQESGMKYFLLGAFSSAFFLLGIAFVYGAVGSTNIYGDLASPDCSGPGLATFANCAPVSGSGLLIIAAGLLIVGLGFKVAVVPFHMWTPDAYQGAPSPVTGFMAAGSKLAGFAALLRLLVVGLYSLRDEWRPLVIGVAILTMLVGSVLAVVQENLKRLLAYSSIAHAGFVLTGVVAANDRGVSGSLFYLATYGVTVLGGFAIVSVLADRDERRVTISDYRGLFDDHPMLAAGLTLFLLSLAGVPLTSGFVGKLVVFGAAVEAGYGWVVVVGVLASAIAAFFYLKVIVAMFMHEREGEPVARARSPLGLGVIALAAAATIFFGLLWTPLIEMASDATFFAGS